MTRVLLAPDKFKGTLTAAAVVEHLSAGLSRVRPDVELVPVPVADGGDGLLDAAHQVGFAPVEVEAADARGTRRRTHYARRDRQAVAELAEVCGLSLMGDRLEPLTAHSRGLGEVVAAALDAGCSELVIGVGGSASTDGGAGMLRALGARTLDERGDEVAEGGAGLREVTRVDLDGLHPRLADVEVVVACDVDNPLTGPHGAAAVYGPQKGASEDDVRLLDAALTHWADVLARHTGEDHRDGPGAGAAGGVAFAAVAALGARLRPGAEVVFELTGFRERLEAGADLVVTGEGSLDEQTLRGKAPASVAAIAREYGVPVVAVAGRCPLDRDRLTEAGFATAYPLTAETDDPDEPMTAPGPLLERIGARIAEGLAGSAP